MEEDQVKPSSQPPSPLASLQKDQALSRQWLGVKGSSVLPLSETEKKGAFVNVDEEWKDDAGQELSPMGNICGRELCLWEEMSVQEFYQLQEEMTSQCEVGVTVRWGERTQQELYPWEENMIGQYPWHEDDRCQECSQWEEVPTYQELSQREGEGYQGLSLLRDVRGHPHMYQLEVGKRHPQLSQAGDNSDKELSQGRGYSVEELPQWEKNKSDQRQSQQEESVSSQRPCQWGGVIYKTWDKPVQTKNDEDAETCAQQRPSSSISIGTQVSGEAACELLSTSPALASHPEAEPAAVGAMAGAAEEKPPEPLPPKEEKAQDSPVLSDEVPLAGTVRPETESPESPTSHSTSVCSQALLDLAGHISSEVQCKAGLEVQASGQQPEEQRDLEQSMAVELEAAAPAERKERPISAPLSPFCLSSPSPRLLGAQASGQQPEEKRDLEQSMAAELEAVAPAERKERPISAPLSPSCLSSPSPRLLGAQASGQQPEEKRDLEQSMAAELEAAAPAERKERPISAPFSPSCLSSPSPRLLGAQVLSKQEEEADRESSLSGQGLQGGQEREKGTFTGELELFQYDDEEDSEMSQQEMNKHQEVSQGEACMEPELSPGEAGSYQELPQREACTEQELSPGEAGSDQELSPGEACTEQELSPGEIGSYQELSQGEDFKKQELYPEESRSYLEFSDWEECMEKGLSEEGGSSQKLSNCDEYSEQELSPQVSSYQELSDWEESTGQELSEEEDSIGRGVSKGNINRPSMQSSWENDSDKELMQDSWEHMSVHSTEVKPLLQNEYEWDNLSVLELSEEEDRDKRLGHFTEDGLPGSVPQEAWVEPYPQVPLSVLPPHVKAQAPRGPEVSPAFKKQVPEAGPAPYIFPSNLGPQLGAQTLRWQPAPHKKHPSYVRPALRVLCRQFCCPCLAPKPED